MCAMLVFSNDCFDFIIIILEHKGPSRLGPSRFEKAGIKLQVNSSYSRGRSRQYILGSEDVMQNGPMKHG